MPTKSSTASERNGVRSRHGLLVASAGASSAGFRASPGTSLYDYPLAWRCPIVPAYWTLQSHGGMYDVPSSQMEQWFGEEACRHEYSSASGQFPFEWSNMAFSTPTELALRFVRQRREIACAGWGPDPEYVRWFNEVLEMTKPNGLYYAFAEFQAPTGHLYTHMTRVDRLPLPPPGWAAEGELSEHGVERQDISTEESVQLRTANE